MMRTLGGSQESPRAVPMNEFASGFELKNKKYFISLAQSICRSTTDRSSRSRGNLRSFSMVNCPRDYENRDREGQCIGESLIFLFGTRFSFVN